MNYEVIFLESAVEGLREMIAYIIREYQDANAANALRKKIIEKVDTLGDFPNTSPVRFTRKGKDIRIVYTKKRAILYSVDKSHKRVYIEAIIYGRRDIEKYVDELFGEAVK